MRGLMAHALRDRNTPTALAASRQVIDFQGVIADFDRLSEIVEADLRSLEADALPADWRRLPVAVRLAFGFADLRETLPTVSGTVTTSVPAVCQRCLEACRIDLDVDIGYLLLQAGQSASDAEGYEVWDLDESAFRPIELVEEALIMALPMSAMHSRTGECGPIAPQVDEVEAEKSLRPFANLREMMRDMD